MKMKLIAAVSVDGAIGNDDKLLWDLRDDLKRYKQQTIGNVVIMGRKTYDELPLGAQSDRIHVIVRDFNNAHVLVPETGNHHVSYSIADAVIKAKDLAGDDKEIIVAGGSFIYHSMIDLCDTCEITWVDKLYPEANKRFPIVKLFTDFHISGDCSWVNDKGLNYKYTTYTREQ